MNDGTQFDGLDYFRQLHAESELATRGGFQFCTSAGVAGLEEALEKFQSANAFFIVDDTTTGNLSTGSGAGWFNRRAFTVFLLRRYTFNDLADRRDAMDKCRALFRSLMSRMIRDSQHFGDAQVWLQTRTVLYKEFSEFFLSGTTGLFFTIEIMEPERLVFNTDEWHE